MNVFVTGGTGLLGNNLIRILLKQNFCVYALTRNEIKHIKHPNLHCINGNLFSDQIHLLKNVDYFVHIAAETRQDIVDYEDYKKINADAVKHWTDQCKLSKIKRFIFVSTANICGFDPIGNEESPTQYPFTQSLYTKSKIEAEFILKSSQLNYIIISPSFMIGPFDYKPSSGRLLEMALGKKIIFYPKGGKSFVHVNDVCQAIIKSFNHGNNGEKFLLVNENLTYKEFYQLLLSIRKQDSLLIPLPQTLLNGIGKIGDILQKIKIKTEINSTNMAILGIKNYYTNEKAKNQLDIRFTPISQAIKDYLNFKDAKEE